MAASRKPFNPQIPLFYRLSRECFVFSTNVREPNDATYKWTQTHAAIENFELKDFMWRNGTHLHSSLLAFQLLTSRNKWFMMSTSIAFVRRLAPFEVDCTRCDVTVGRIEVVKYYFCCHSTHQRWICELLDCWQGIVWLAQARARDYCPSESPNKKVQVESSAKNLVNQSHTMAESINYTTFHDFVDYYCLLCAVCCSFFSLLQSATIAWLLLHHHHRIDC